MATGSIVDYLKSQGQASDFNSRAALAKQYGITNYTGTAAQNTQLLGVLQKAPDTQGPSLKVGLQTGPTGGTQTGPTGTTGPTGPVGTTGPAAPAPFDYKKWGITDAQWAAMDAGSRAFVEGATKTIQGLYDTGSANVALNAETYQKALVAAQNDPDIQAKYGDALTVAKENITRNLSYLNAEFNQQDALTRMEQEKAAKQLTETEAAAGRAYSGFRQQAEQQLSQQQQGVIESSKRTLQQSIQGQVSPFEQTYGTSALSSLGSLTAGGQAYKPIGGLTGSVGLSKKEDIQKLAQNIYSQEKL